MTTRRFSCFLALASCLALSACDKGESPADKPPQKPADEPADTPAEVADGASNRDPSVTAGADAEPVDGTTSAPPPGGDEPETALVTRPELSFADEATKAKAAGLAKQLDGTKFPYDLVKQPDNAVAFLHLAHTADDPTLAAAALRAVEVRHSDREREGYRKVDADYHAVVAFWLKSTDVNVLTAAFEAAGHSAEAEPPSSDVVELLVEHAVEHDSLAARHLALDALSGVKVWTGPVQAAFLRALDEKSPEFLALALDELEHDVRKFADQKSLEAKLVAFTKHAYAGVRGQAVAALCNAPLDPAYRERIAKVVAPLLEDPDSFVRAQAVYGLASMRRMAMADEIVKRLDDDGSGKFVVDGWTGLDGSANRQTLLAPGGSTVAGVALLSLSLLATETDTEFEYVDDIKRDGTGGEDYTVAIAKAKTWYAANKTKFGGS